MADIDLRNFGDTFVIHYGGQPSQVDAFTFANSLIEISEAIRAINARISPDLSIEISIDALGEGSFRARLKSSAKWILGQAKTAAPQVLIGLLVAFIYDKLLSDPEINIEVTGMHMLFSAETTVLFYHERYTITKGGLNVTLTSIGEFPKSLRF